MPTFRYIGDPAHGGEGPGTVELFGYRFPKGEPVEVTAGPALVKLPRNSHFEEVEAAEPAKGKAGGHKG